MEIQKQFKASLLEFDKVKVEKVIQSYLSENHGSEKVFSLISQTLSNLGEEWSRGEIALSQIYMSGRICEELIEKQFQNRQSNLYSGHNIAISTLTDHHLLGKKIIYSSLLSSGFKVIDFGAVGSASQLVEKTINNKIDILLISTLMYHSALKVKEVKELLIKSDSHVKILVGGAPFTFDKELWKQVGADEMGETASDALRVINQWIGRN
jgi:methanogenic corrinoid protein MtbC1